MPVKLQDGTTEVDIKLLPDGRSLVHWLRECETGLVVVQGHPELRRVMGRTPEGRYTVACNPKQTTVSSQKRGDVRFMCITSGDPAAVTCSKCLATPEAIAALAAPTDERVAQLTMDAIRGVK